eukprot:gene373-6787_t
MPHTWKDVTGIVDFQKNLSEKTYTKYNKVPDGQQVKTYEKMITTLVTEKDFTNVVANEHVNCYYYALNFFIQTKTLLKVNCDFFYGKFYVIDEKGKVTHDHHVIPCVQHVQDSITRGYTICDDALTFSIPVFLHESGCFIGKEGVTLTVSNGILVQHNYKSFKNKAPKQCFNSFGFFYLVKVDKLMDLILDDLLDQSTKSNLGYNAQYSKLVVKEIAKVQ